MGRRTVLPAVVAGLVTVAACGPTVETPIDSAPAADPVDLVGLWRVDAAGEGADTWLRMDAGGFILWRGAGAMEGSWDAGGRDIVADAWAYFGDDTSRVGSLDATWLVGTHTYRVTDDGWQLLDAAGSPVASMTVDGAPEPVRSASDQYVQTPEVTEETREALAPPASLPDGVEPADAADLEGRWVPAAESYPTDPHVVFHDDGGWEGSDGCNGVGGRWAVAEDDGRLLSTSGPMTAIWCEGAPVGGWVGEAARAGLDGGELVLLARDGTELGRLTAD